MLQGRASGEQPSGVIMYLISHNRWLPTTTRRRAVSSSMVERPAVNRNTSVRFAPNRTCKKAHRQTDIIMEILGEQYSGYA
jgi:hypothetical protein